MARSTHRSRGLRWLAGLTMFALLAAAGIAPSAAVAADEPTNMVLVWNENAINVIGGPNPPPVTTPPTAPGLGQPPPLAPIHLAMVHGAIYDAVIAIEGGYEPYLDGLSAPASASKAAAVAQAAHDVLIGITPATLPLVKARVDGMLAASLALIDAGPAKTAGTAVGAQAAAAMLAERATDGRFGAHMFDVGSDPGEWRPVEPLLNNVFGWVAYVVPFTLKSPKQFRTAGPPALASRQYAREFNEVKSLGAQTGSSRTPEQSLLAYFVSANPFVFMHRGLREIAVAKGLSTTEQARLFVKTSMAVADSLIGCWDSKDYHEFWRPLTAIREAANDGNRRTSPQADWTTVIPTPGYPDSPSGFNCFTAGMWHSVKAYFGTDRMSFSLTSPGVPVGLGVPVALPGSTRNYTRFTQVVDDAIDGRILNGLHFRHADVQGAGLGRKVANWVNKHYFRPVD